MVRHGAVAAAMLCAAALAGCAPDNGPMQLPRGLGIAMAPMDRGAFATLPACSTDGPVEIKVLRIEALAVEGADKVDVDFRVAWPSEQRPAKIGAGPVPVPDMYTAAEGATGKLVECGTAPRRELDIAVVLPRATVRPVFVHDVAVTYEVGGNVYRAEADDVDLGICVETTSKGEKPPEGCGDD